MLGEEAEPVWPVLGPVLGQYCYEGSPRAHGARRERSVWVAPPLSSFSDPARREERGSVGGNG